MIRSSLSQAPTMVAPAWPLPVNPELMDPAPYLAQMLLDQAVPTLVLTLDLALIWSNKAGRRLLAEREEFQLDAEHVSLCDPKRSPVFKAAIDRLGERPAAFTHRRRSGNGYLIIRMERFLVPGRAPAVLLTLQSSTATDRYLWADFAPVFCLTRSETIVVKMLVGGKGADEIARALSLSVGTVRTHIKRIYAKVGVNSRERLFHSVLPFRLG